MGTSNHPCGIALVGLPGVGKSTVAARLAALLDWRAIDLDEFLEQTSSRTISSWFRDVGEAAFRQAELDALRDITQAAGEHPLVLATGGGVVVPPAARSLLQANWVCVYLQAEVSTLAERVRRQSTVRPLLDTPDSLSDRLQALQRQRAALYESVAAHIIRVDGLQADEVASAIASLPTVVAWISACTDRADG